RIPVDEPFIVLATQNPIESRQGTFDLPEAQMDRFLMKIDLGYPSREEEKLMLDTHGAQNALDGVRPVFSKDEIIELQSRLSSVEVNDAVQEYALDIIHSSRNHEHVDTGVSPRGTIALLQAAKGIALIRGRHYVMPDDIKYIAPFVISHSLVLDIDGIRVKNADVVISDIANSVEVPVEYGVLRDEV